VLQGSLSTTSLGSSANDDDSPHIVQAKFEIVCASDDDQGPAVSFVIRFAEMLCVVVNDAGPPRLVVSLDGPTVQADFGMLIEMKKEFVYLWSLVVIDFS
jgi:hypothetical protein